MSRLPTITPRQAVAALLKSGFEEKHQRGSHLYLYHPVRQAWTTVPMHARDLHRGLLKAILKQVGLSEDEFREML